MRQYLLLLLACLSGDWSQPRVAAAATNQADVEFHQLADEFLAGYLAWRPGLAVALGLHEFDGRVTDYSRVSVNLERVRLANFDRRLARFPARRLSPREAYDFRILRSAVLKQVFRFDAMRSFSRNPMTYAGAMDVNLYVKRDFAPLEERVRYIIAVLEQAPATFAAARANLDASLPRPFIQTALQVAEGSADFLEKDLVEALSGLKDGPLRARFKAAKERAAGEVRAYAKWLQESRLPGANDDYSLGREKFARMLGEGELIELPPERILATGLRELRREQQLFAESARLIDPAKQPIEVFKAIQKDHPTEQSLIPDTRQNLETIRRFLVDKQILTIPSDVRARVEETPKFDRATSFASMDTPGPFEKTAAEAYYYVTPVEPEWPAPQKEEWLTAFNYYTTDVVSIHEAYPGHYVQFLCLNASPANRLEKILDSYAFVEGWAHYTEQMILDAGFGPNMPSRVPQSDDLKTAKYRLAQSDEALLRLCRLCVAIKMHCQGMTVDEATKFFQDNCYYEQKPARQEAIRGAYDPEYLYYTLGKLQILKLRRDYEKQEGANYSLKKFHDECLRHGMPPIRLLREVMLKDPKMWDQVF
ncbi:MAG TPA: DUF885 domain-containing protein [Verrucomicrobiae bacterium]|nr:DUF885 domain-containing protein [Verrucomicrobiae bacterium]